MRLFPAKSPKRASLARQTLQAAIARRGSRTPSIEEEEEEPTTSFKTALVVVLLLHVVAGVGILMFDRIKSRQPATVATASATAAPKPTASAPSSTAQKPAAVAPAPVAQKQAPAPAVHPKVAATSAPAVEISKKPTSAVAEAKDSGTLYAVGKGDTPVSIAKKLHVAYDDLLKLNRIDDPKKLRIGQKLHVPVKPRASAN